MVTLLVSADPVFGDNIAAALEGLGDVMWCHGPSGADSVCPATRDKVCPLTTGIDAVVVDTWLPGDWLRDGFRSAQLVAYYERLGLPLVALTVDHQASGALRFGPRTVVLSRQGAPADIVAAVTGAVALRPSAGLDRPA